MRRALLPLVGLYAYLAFFFLLAAFVPLVGIASLLHRSDPTMRVPGRWVRKLGRALGWAMPIWRLSIEGERPEGIDEKGFVVVSNHESSVDPLLLSWLPWDMRWVAKQELFDLPVAGWILKMGGDIPIARGRSGSAKAMLQACKETVRQGLSVMLFPEGTRSKGEALLPFRDGAFEIAIETGAPILPIALAGTRDCRPKGSLWFGWAHAKARILEPIPTAGLGPGDLPALRDQVRARISEEVRSLREELE